MRRDPAASHLTVSLDGDDAAMHVDIELIRAALVNLLLNGAQAVGPSGAVRVRTVAGSMVTVDVPSCMAGR